MVDLHFVLGYPAGADGADVVTLVVGRVVFQPLTPNLEPLGTDFT